MEIVPLGVGDAFAKTLFQTNFLVRPAEGEAFLVDCGHTASRALARLGVDPRSARRVVLSHLHADHIGGLEELGFTGQFRWGVRPTLLAPPSVLAYLWPNALAAGMGQRLAGPDGSFFDADLATYFDVRPVAPRESFEMGSVVVTPYSTPHTAGRPCFGYRLADRATGAAVLLTCDTRFHRRNLERWGDGAAAVFHDCQLASSAAHIHATLEELLTLPSHWQERVLLVHYADDWMDWEGRTGALRFAQEGRGYRF